MDSEIGPTRSAEFCPAQREKNRMASEERKMKLKMRDGLKTMEKNIKRSFSKEECSESIGVSGVSVYFPRLKVSLSDWCDWTGYPYEKVLSTVGNSFRMAAPSENIYTMAANAVLKLILNYNIDPQGIGFLGLGTESSNDNSAGAIIVKGMVNRALEQLGRSKISRQCEVPEFKHACLGGIYALKNALRYLATDGKGRSAIVVSVDIAEYEPGSSGEPTQGAGAVAQLLENNPKLYAVDLENSGSASDYRGIDFRKPHLRHLYVPPLENAIRLHDYPVFNGKFSTICYTDQAIQATMVLLEKLGLTFQQLCGELEGFFFHRPFSKMPVNIFAALYIWGLTRSCDNRKQLSALSVDAEVDLEEVMTEAHSRPDLYKHAMNGCLNEEIYPEAMKLVKFFRRSKGYQDIVSTKMHLGTALMLDVGNIYTGSLAAWCAAGIEEAFEQGYDLTSKVFFTLGYGSGDAAEAMLIKISPTWRDYAAKIGFQKSLENPIELTKRHYEQIQKGLPIDNRFSVPQIGFVIDRVGKSVDPQFQDRGIQYYKFVG